METGEARLIKTVPTEEEAKRKVKGFQRLFDHISKDGQFLYVYSAN